MSRIKQFYINLIDKMNEEDYIYVEEILEKNEYELFLKLLKSEQKHSVRVARNIQDLIDYIVVDDVDIVKNRDILIKASLLHDVGKSKTKVNIIDKSIIVILNNITNGRLKYLKNKKIDCYYNHSKYSIEMLNNFNLDKDLLYVIENHHKKTNNKLIEFFQYIDDKN